MDIPTLLRVAAEVLYIVAKLFADQPQGKEGASKNQPPKPRERKGN